MSSSRHPVVAAAGILGLALVATSCGKEGPPQPPRPRGPLPPRSLESRQLGPGVQILFTVPDSRGSGPGQQVTTAELVRVTYPPGIDPPPDPDTFRRRGDVVAETGAGALVPGERVLLEDRSLAGLEDQALGWTLRYAVRVRDAKRRVSMLAVAADLVPLESVGPPQDLTGEPTAEGVRLDWAPPEVANREEPLTYNVYRTALGDLWPGEPLNNEPLTVTEYLDGDVKVGQLYAYTVRVALAGGKPYREGEPSRADEVVAEDRFAPATPGGLVSVQEGRGVRLFWDPNRERDLAGYRVFRMIEGGEWAPVGLEIVEQNSFLDAAVAVGQRWSYRVVALDQAVPPNFSEFSDTVELEILEEPVNPGGEIP
jgi:hypothetical protein